MTLEEVRKMIDCVDTQIKPLFLERMACAEHVAAAKAENGKTANRNNTNITRPIYFSFFIKRLSSNNPI